MKGGIECFRAFLCRTCERNSCLSSDSGRSYKKIVDSFLTTSVFLLLQYIDLYVLLYTSRCANSAHLAFAGIKTNPPANLDAVVQGVLGSESYQ